jgi:hypothetical protein
VRGSYDNGPRFRLGSATTFAGKFNQAVRKRTFSAALPA